MEADDENYRDYYEQYEQYYRTISVSVAVIGGYMHSRKHRRRSIQRRYGVHPIYQLRDDKGAFNHLYQELRKDHERFFKSFRMTIAQFDQLLLLVAPHLRQRDTFRHNPLPDEFRLVVTIAFLSHGDSIHTLSALFRIGISTCREILKEVCVAIGKALLPVYVKPPTAEDFKKIADDFCKRWNLPHCLGAVDGKHVQLKAPAKSGSEYFNYKKNHSINLMAFCDANYCFTVAEVGYLGSMSDGGIFRESPFCQAITDRKINVPEAVDLPNTPGKKCNYFFVGDEAFALKENFLIPFGGAALNVKDKAVQIERRIFNYRLSRARRVIENCFGILANRWRILHKKIEAMPATATLYVQACVCLHNYIMKTNAAENSRNPGECGDIFGQNDRLLVPGTWRNDKATFTNTEMRANRNPPKSAQAQREMIAKYLTYDYALDYQVARVTMGATVAAEAIATSKAKK